MPGVGTFVVLGRAHNPATHNLLKLHTQQLAVAAA